MKKNLRSINSMIDILKIGALLLILCLLIIPFILGIIDGYTEEAKKSKTTRNYIFTSFYNI